MPLSREDVKCGKVQGRLLGFLINLSRDAAQRRQLVMKSGSIALSQRLTGPGTGSLQAATSQRAFHRAAFGHSLAVLSVAAALGIKFILQRFNVGYPLSSSFLAAIAICLNEQVIFNEANL